MLVMFSVIAAIIIVAPISFYELSPHSSGISVKSFNTVTNLTFAVNFTKYTETSIQFNPNYENFSSVTMIDQNGSNSSALEIEGYIFEDFISSQGFYILGLNMSDNFEKALKIRELAKKHNEFFKESIPL